MASDGTRHRTPRRRGHAIMHGIETPENTRRLCLDAPGRPARPHEPRRQPPPPSHNREKTSRTGHGRTIRKSPRPHQAGGRGRPPAGKGAHAAPLQTPAGPRRRTPPRRRAPPSGTTAKRAKPYQTKEPRRRHVRSRDARPPKGAIIASRPRPRRGHGTIPPHGTRPKGRAGPFFSFRPVGFASGSYRRRGTRQRATQRAAPGVIAQ